jgi:Fe-S-cluster-containing hydrogenase component 2
LVLSSDFNAKGYHYPIVQTAADCVDCKLCELLCPEYAIVVTAVATKADGATAASGSDDDGASALAPLNVLMVGG